MAAPACPLRTPAACSAAECGSHDVLAPELRAYKLGKRRWSYNQVELVLREGGGERVAAVVQAAASGAEFAEAHQGSAVGFLLQLDNGAKVQAHVYCCYADAQPCSPGAAATAAGGEERGEQFSWSLVTRQHCCKGCEGPVLRAIQRFGRMGSRQAKAAAEAEPESSSSGAPPAAAAAGGGPPRKQAAKKDPRFMYLSLDEACTHVDASAFRLVAGIYNRQGIRLLGTAVSPPIRVLANNDVPTGAARIPLEAALPADWEGWSGVAGARRAAAQPVRRKRALAEEQQLLQPPPGLRTPRTNDTLRLPASPELLVLGSTAEQWQHMPASPAQPRLRVARQLSLPSQPPSPPLAGSGSGSGSMGDASCGLGAVAAEQLWTVPPAELAAQLAPSLPFYSCSQVAAQHEAERQLSLLQQLKASVASVCHPSTSGCSSPSQPAGGCGGGSVHFEMQQSPSRPSATLPTMSSPVSAPTRAPSFVLPPADSMATADTALPAAIAIAVARNGSAAGSSPAGGCGGLPQPQRELGTGLGPGCSCSLDDELELETLHSMMVDSDASRLDADMPLFDDVMMIGW